MTALPDSQETKHCNGCPGDKPLDAFGMNRTKAGVSIRRSLCKECDKKAQTAYRARLREARRAATAESSAERLQSQPAPGKGGSEAACICSLTVAVKDGHRLYGTNPACPVEAHKRIIGGYEPHKAQKSGAQVKYNGMVHGY